MRRAKGAILSAIVEHIEEKVSLWGLPLAGAPNKMEVSVVLDLALYSTTGWLSSTLQDSEDL